MKIAELKKEHEGHTVYLHGKDNARSRTGITPLKVVEVVKVSRAKATVREGTREFTMSTRGTTPQHYNYDMYSSLDSFTATLAISKIRDMFSSHRNVEASTEQLMAIADILEIDLKSETERYLTK